MMKRGLIAMAACALGILGASGVVTVIPENGTLTIGGVAAEPNGCNKQGGFIVFSPGSTLVLTQINTSATIWATLVATNGAGTIRAESGYPSIQGHVVASGEGSLTLTGVSSFRLGHDIHYPVVDLSHLRAGPEVTTFALGHCSLVALPEQEGFPLVFSEGGAVRLVGGHDMVEGDTLSATRNIFCLCNETAVPAGKKISVSGSGFVRVTPLTVPSLDGVLDGRFPLQDLGTPTPGLTIGCSVELGAGRHLIFTNKADVAFSGRISGAGSVTLSGGHTVTLSGDNTGSANVIYAKKKGSDLVLSNENSACDMTLKMWEPITVRGAEGIAAATLGAVEDGASVACRVEAAANQALTVKRFSGCATVGGAGKSAGSVVDFLEVAAGSSMFDDGGATLKFGGSEALPENAVGGVVANGQGRLIGFSANGVVDVSTISAIGDVGAPVLCYDVKDGDAVVGDSSAVTLRAAEGVSATLRSMGNDTFSVAGEGSFTVAYSGSFTNEVSWWYDFSRASTRFRICEGSTDAYLDRVKAAGQPYIERVVDWRKPNETLSLWNRRAYKGGSSFEVAEMVYPFVVPNGPAGLDYLCFDSVGNSRRLPFAKPTGYNAEAATSCEAQLVVMVFGGQKGGGYAVVGTAEGAFGRNGTSASSCITTNTAHDVWVNGAKVADPSTEALGSDWKIVSIALDGLHFSGLGFTRDVNGERGGQNYGEVLVFTNAVTARTRLEAELYLARKWGLEEQYSAAAKAELASEVAASVTRVRAAGAPTLVGDVGTLEVEGSFGGTVRLAGGTLSVPNRRLPYTEAEIPSENRLYWADPDDVATVLRYGEANANYSDSAARANEIRAVKDKSVREFVDGEPIMIGVSTRMPYWFRSARGFGPERGWIDFNNVTDPGTDGNCLRFVGCTPGINWASPSGTLSEMNVRTAFFVQDSLHGGGNPMLADVLGNGAIAKRTQHLYSESIWPNGRPAAFSGGENRLNGEVVDYTKGFTGLPEVFSVRGTEAANAPVVGFYANSEGSSRQGEIIGEMLFYSAELPDADVQGIEAYLMGKWLGTLPAGFADLRGATVSGTGRVQVAVAAQRPTVDPSFEGSVAIVAGGAFTMTVDPATGRVTGALACPKAQLDLPAACTLTLDFKSVQPTPSDLLVYPLVDCASYANPVEWTLVKGANAPRRGRFQQTGNRIVFRIPPVGFSINLR